MRADPHPFFGAGFVAMAHRGGAGLAANVGRENTLAAFGAAVRLGYQYLETDVRTTADGVPIVFHDAELDRVSDASGVVAELPWAEVSLARVGGETIPTLDEALSAYPVKFNIDIKTDAAVAGLAEAIRRHGAADRVCVGSFSPRRLRAFRRASGGSVATSASTVATVLAAYSPVGVGRRAGNAAIAYQVPVRHRVGGVAVRVLTKGLLRRAGETGRSVQVWTVNDPRQMAALIDAGVGGLITDRIDVLRALLIERGLW